MWGSVGDRHAQASTFGKPFFFFLSHTDKEIIQKKKKGGKGEKEEVEEEKEWEKGGVAQVDWTVHLCKAT